MGFLSKLFSGSSIFKEIGNVVDEFHLSGEEKQEFKLKMESLLQERDNQLQESLRTELSAKERVLVAELQQGNAFTKCARPAVVYFGLIVIAINHVIGPWAAYLADKAIPAIELPTDFWVAWGGIVATWSIGRTFEKVGAKNKAVSVITGAPKTKLID